MVLSGQFWPRSGMPVRGPKSRKRKVPGFLLCFFFISSKFINSCLFARRSEKNVRSTHRATNKLIIQTKSNNKLPRIINKQCARCGWRRLEFKRNSVQPVWKDDALLEEGELLEFDWVHGEILWTQTYIQKYIFFNF